MWRGSSKLPLPLPRKRKEGRKKGRKAEKENKKMSSFARGAHPHRHSQRRRGGVWRSAHLLVLLSLAGVFAVAAARARARFFSHFARGWRRAANPHPPAGCVCCAPLTPAAYPLPLDARQRHSARIICAHLFPANGTTFRARARAQRSRAGSIRGSARAWPAAAATWKNLNVVKAASAHEQCVFAAKKANISHL